MEKILKRNIRGIYTIKIIYWFMLFMPVIVLFFNDNGLNLNEIMIIQSVYSVTIVVLEIPSGYVADIWGRKNSICLGSLFVFTGYVLFSLSYSFTGFFIAQLFMGTGLSFISGSDSALLYDTLLATGKEKEYVKYEGWIISAGNFSEASAAVIGGILAGYSLRYPYYGQALISLFAIPVAFSCIEPPQSKKTNKTKKEEAKEILKAAKYAILQNVSLRRGIILSAITGTATLMMSWMVQPYLKLLDTPIEWYGIIWTVLNLSVGLISMFAYKIEQKIGTIKSLLLIVSLLSLGFLSIGFIKAWWAVGFILLFYLTRGIATPLLKDYVNRRTTSDIRATVLSVRSFVIRLIFAGFGPFIGWWSDIYSLQSALLLFGIFYLITASFLLLIISISNI